MYCRACLGRHVAEKVRQGQVSVPCPDPPCGLAIGRGICEGLLSTELKEIYSKVIWIMWAIAPAHVVDCRGVALLPVGVWAQQLVLGPS